MLPYFEQLLSNFRYKKQLLPFFRATFQQLYEKLRATFWEISSNLWQALRGGGGLLEPPPWVFVLLRQSEIKLHRLDSPELALQGDTIFVGFEVI